MTDPLPADESQWPTPTTFDEVAAQEAIRSARAQGLPDQITDPATIARLATLARTPRREDPQP